jgi:hypothetical protein
MKWIAWKTGCGSKSAGNKKVIQEVLETLLGAAYTAP